MFSGPFAFSIIKRALDKKLISIDFVNIRDFALDAYKTVDDSPYGGGRGMILKVDVLDAAINSTKKKNPGLKTITILLDPQAVQFTQSTGLSLIKLEHIILICGHYEGVDDRVSTLVDKKISIGKYVLTGGELPAMVIVDTVTRLLPGVLPENALSEESFKDNMGEYPQFTRPRDYKGMSVPVELLSGDHKKIALWRRNRQKKLLISK